jgi:putative tryptophan/tyrosine transport system substrate-binding protein
MKRRLRSAWAALLLLCAANVQASPPPAEYHVMMLLYRGCEEACQGFQDYFRRQRIPVRFTVRDAAQDKTRIAGFVAEAKRTRPDLVVTWGTTVSLEAVGRWDSVDPDRHLTDMPVVFMIVSQPVELGLVPTLRSSRRNLTGSLYLLPVEDQLRAARAYFDFRQVGFLINPAEANSQASLDALRAQGPHFGFSVLEQRVDVDGAGSPVAASLKDKVAALASAGADLLYLSPDTFLNSQRRTITGAAVALGLPVFAAAEAPVLHADALFGVVNRYDQVGRFTARQAVRILRDQVKPANIPIELPRQFSYLINLRVAHLLGRYPPLPLLDIAEIVGNDEATNQTCPQGKKCD